MNPEAHATKVSSVPKLGSIAEAAVGPMGAEIIERLVLKRTKVVGKEIMPTWLDLDQHQPVSYPPDTATR